MKTIDLMTEKIDLSEVMRLADQEPVLLICDGKEFILRPADDFEAEVEALRNSARFQAFLDERSKCQVRIPIAEIEEDVDDEVQSSTND